MAAGDIASLVAVVGVVFAIWLARRKGRNRFTAAISQARAEGHAEAKVELAASLANVVNVQVDAGRSGTREVTGDDLFLEVLRRAGVSPARDDYHHLAARNHDDFQHDSWARVLGTSRRNTDEQFVDRGPGGREHRSADGHVLVSGPQEMSTWERPA